MAHVVGLFSDSNKAADAVVALDALELEEGTFRTVESPGEFDVLQGVAAAPFSTAGASEGIAGVGTGVVSWSGLDDLDIDEDAIAFFQRSLADGATLVVADVDDEQATTIKDVMEQHGGRVATG